MRDITIARHYDCATRAMDFVGVLDQFARRIALRPNTGAFS
ncbi:hypothetical protein [Rhodoblastus sp.]